MWMTLPLRSNSLSESSSLLRAARPLCRASVLWALRRLRLCRLPLHRNDRFTRSVRKPNTRSRRLYTGCRLAHKEVLSSLILREAAALSFDIMYPPHDMSSAVRLRSSPCISSAEIFVSTFPSTLSTKALYPSTLRRFGFSASTPIRGA